MRRESIVSGMVGRGGGGERGDFICRKEGEEVTFVLGCDRRVGKGRNRVLGKANP